MTDPRTALEALEAKAEEHRRAAEKVALSGEDWRFSNGYAAAVRDLRAALATPPATEERCGWTDGTLVCPFPTIEAFHVGPESCENRLTGYHGEIETCHAFVPTPPAPEPPAPVAPMEGITPKEWDAFEAATGTVERCVYPGCTLRDDKGQCAECDRERDHWVHGSDVKFNAGHPFRPQPTPLTDEALRARGEFEAYLFGHLSACAPSDSVFRQVWASMLRHLDNLAAALAARQEGS